MGGAASTPSWSSRRLPGTSLPPVRISLHDRPTPPARAVASERSLASEGGAGTPRGGRDDAAKTELRRQHSSPALKADADLRRDSLEAAPRHSTSAAPRHSGSPARRNSPSLSLRSGLLSVRRPTVTPRTAREVGEAMATEATGEVRPSSCVRLRRRVILVG
ncbi:hypothetical protein M885DRAFT_58710 [Pelagophyceae sp. CCMP2097]|nr:hypothetical protein M885DRAFT_58710 [Pelagophyceae sp. CCMP2097]